MYILNGKIVVYMSLKKWRHKIFIKFMPYCKDMFSDIPNIISIHFREEQECHIPTLLRALQMKIGLRLFEEFYTNSVLRFIFFPVTLWF